MNKVIKGTLFIIVSGFFLLLYSCTPQSCFEQTDAFVKTSLYLNKTGKLLAPDSLTVYGLNMATNKLYDKSKSITIAQLPLNASLSHSTFIIKINGITDTLELRYTSYPHLISKECGYTFYHNLQSDSLVYSRNIIDSVYIRNNNITTLNEENIRIFYKSPGK
jgi:hypothetical protein